MLQFGRDIGVDTVEQVLKLFARIDISDVSEHFHFFFKFVLEKPIMYSDYSFDVDAADHILHEIFRMETRFNQIYATHKPFLVGLTLLQTDISTCLELSQQFSDGNFVNISQLFVDRLIHTFNVVDLFLLQIVDLL
jgi:hypothetical protein